MRSENRVGTELHSGTVLMATTDFEIRGSPLRGMLVRISKNRFGRDWTNEQKSPRVVQRRRNRGDHHDHGVYVESPYCRWPVGTAPGVAYVWRLRIEFRDDRNLLEQPSPYAACRAPGEWRDFVGESALFVLVVAGSVCNRLVW